MRPDSLPGERCSGSGSGPSSTFSTHLSSELTSKSLTMRPAKQNMLVQAPSRCQYSCQRGCDKVFESSKDLDRHYATRAHATASRDLYICRDGYFNSRKNHYCRHLAQMSCLPQRPHFKCICSERPRGDDMNENRAHVKLCIAGRRACGRPKKTALKTFLATAGYTGSPNNDEASFKLA